MFQTVLSCMTSSVQQSYYFDFNKKVGYTDLSVTFDLKINMLLILLLEQKDSITEFSMVLNKKKKKAFKIS